MIDGIRLKVCGLTTIVDAEFADRVGADLLGFILHPNSPRHLSLANYRAMKGRLPTGRRRVAVLVEPSEAELAAADAEEFDLFQIHFRPDLPLEQVARWSEQVSPARLWLAPKLAESDAFIPEWLDLAGSILVDTYRADGFGGTGRTGDWPRFAQLRAEYPKRTWILAGGLNPSNIGEALVQTDARVIDVNSGVEVAPGVKDHAKLRALVLAIHRARTAQRAEPDAAKTSAKGI